MIDGSDESNGADSLPAERRDQYDWSETSPTRAVVQALAGAANCGPTDMDPLYDYVDPDSLDAIVGRSRTATDGRGMMVSFPVESRQVTVHGDGEVVVRETE